ncbi:MAG: hypothetical protein K2W96_27500 [Gemmataceae bacterium]|nr:hypothetical protein [Gemmataceae bacterium]
MGHSVMLLAVAGQNDDEIKERTRKLTSGDWSSFSPAEQVALQFAAKLTKSPASLADKDLRRLTEAFGRERAMDLIWYGAWCNYMTRVADAIQMPLERENCFMPPPKPKGAKSGGGG